jgi:hypothetical protein
MMNFVHRINRNAIAVTIPLSSVASEICCFRRLDVTKELQHVTVLLRRFAAHNDPGESFCGRGANRRIRRSRFPRPIPRGRLQAPVAPDSRAFNLAQHRQLNLSAMVYLNH